jgi:hypothetical protein
VEVSVAGMSATVGSGSLRGNDKAKNGYGAAVDALVALERVQRAPSALSSSRIGTLRDGGGTGQWLARAGVTEAGKVELSDLGARPSKVDVVELVRERRRDSCVKERRTDYRGFEVHRHSLTGAVKSGIGDCPRE